jgi:hypothetical protein
VYISKLSMDDLIQFRRQNEVLVGLVDESALEVSTEDSPVRWSSGVVGPVCRVVSAVWWTARRAGRRAGGSVAASSRASRASSRCWGASMSTVAVRTSSSGACSRAGGGGRSAGWVAAWIYNSRLEAAASLDSADTEIDGRITSS